MNIEILFKGANQSPRKIEERDRLVSDFIKYLDTKYPAWEEVFISNKSDSRMIIVKGRDRLIQASKKLNIDGLLTHLDETYRDWKRFAISKKSFPLIKYEDCRPGMLVRASTSNTYLYKIVLRESTNEKGEKEIHCNEEGKSVTFNTVRNKDYRFALLAENISELEFEAVEWG